MTPRDQTFGELSRDLESLGFRVVREGEQVVFAHETGRPLFVIPFQDDAEIVIPIHQAMVRRQLLDAGLGEDERGPATLDFKRGRSGRPLDSIADPRVG